MHRAAAADSSDVKPQPYPKESPQKGRAQGIVWTEEMDKIMINEILSTADIKFNYDWPKLQKLFPGLTVLQLKNHWNNKLQGTLFPNEVLKKTKQARESAKEG